LMGRMQGSPHQKHGFCDGLPSILFEAALQGKAGSLPNSHERTPPGTGTSTPSPPCISGFVSRSTGENTPPEQERLQRAIQIVERTRKSPLKPGLLEVSSPSPWPSPSTPVPPLPDLVLMPPPPTPPSLGSVGHPDQCADSCKYVKRKTGCLLGSSCPHCHLCFWQRRSSKSTPQSPAPGGQMGTTESPVMDVDGICVTAYTNGYKDAVEESTGSLGHPEGCAQACKYVHRKGGCRNGSSCPDCHLCHWRRTPTEIPPKQAGLGEKTMPGFSRNSREQLQRLICLQLASDASNESPASPEEVVAGEAAEQQATGDATANVLGPPPGLDHPGLLFTRAPILPMGTVVPR